MIAHEAVAVHLGTRVDGGAIFGLLAAGRSTDEVIEDDAQLDREDVLGALESGAAVTAAFDVAGRGQVEVRLAQAVGVGAG